MGNGESLPIAHCPLPIAKCPFTIAHCPLPIAHSPFTTIYYLATLKSNKTIE
jgi:hypothetical protein